MNSSHPIWPRDMTLVRWKIFENFRWPRDRRRVPFWSRGSRRGPAKWSKCSLFTFTDIKITERLLPKYKHDHPVICGQCLGPLEHRKVVWSPVGRLFDQNWPKRARGGLREPSAGSAVTGQTEIFEIFPTHKSHVPGQIGCVEFISAVKTRR